MLPITPRRNSLVRRIGEAPMRGAAGSRSNLGARCRSIAAGCVIFLFGCANAPKPFDVSGLDPACARSCLSSNSQCVSQASIGTSNRLVVNDVLRACRAAADSCLSTCTPK